MAYVAKRDRNRCPTHPGELLREDVIPATGKTRSEIAALLGISRQHLYDILYERKPVSPTVAVRLGKLFGDGAGVWARMRVHMILGMLNANCPTRSGKYPQSKQRWRDKIRGFQPMRAGSERTLDADRFSLGPSPPFGMIVSFFRPELRLGGIGITDRALREWNALLFYWITGRISVLFPGPMSEISRCNIHEMHSSYER